MLRASTLTLSLALPGVVLAQVEQDPPNADFVSAFVEQTRAPELPETSVSLSVFASGLEHPWGIAALPEGGWLVTERPGRLRLVSEDGSLSDEISGLPEVWAEGQGGLLDVAVGPDFGSDRMVYLTYSKPVEGGAATAAARGVLSEDGSSLEGVEDIFVQTPAGNTGRHFGSRIVFGPDGYVYITTGDRGGENISQMSQDMTTTIGKVLRLLPDGSIPDDNPLMGQDSDDAIWSTGHRNVQGAAFSQDGDFWTVEHGPRGGDELNHTEGGGNYGWPVVSYGIDYDGSPVGEGISTDAGFVEPIYYWDPVIAPSGLAVHNGAGFPEWDNDFLIGSLTPGGLVRLKRDRFVIVGEERLVPEAGRVRDVHVMADGDVLLLTDMPDGQILRLSPAN